MNVPRSPGEQLQWLVDRAEISDLFFIFARAIDDRDAVAYAGTFTEDGRVVLPHVTAEGRAAILAILSGGGHRDIVATLHISANHQILIEDDAATARANLHAVHVFGAGGLPNERAGGWYDARLRRTADGWRFTAVELHLVWNTGEMIPAEPG